MTDIQQVTSQVRTLQGLLDGVLDWLVGSVANYT